MALQPGAVAEHQRLLDRLAAQGREGAAHDAGLAAAPFAGDADGEGWVDLQRHAGDLIAGGAEAEVVVEGPDVVSV
jgi:hypothetical protein